jgi:hypothetical protein
MGNTNWKLVIRKLKIGNEKYPNWKLVNEKIQNWYNENSKN